jgi:alpha-mannosidase
MDFDRLFAATERVLEGALASLATRINTLPGGKTRGKKFSTGRALILFNPLTWDRDEIVKIPFGFPWVRVVDLEGHEIPSQVIYRDGAHWLLFKARVPALGYTQVRLLSREKSPPKENPLTEECIAENRFFRLELNDEGNIQRLYDKELKKDLLCGPANHVQFFKNQPKEWSNWNINPEYENHELTPEGKACIEVLDHGPVLTAFRITKSAAEGGKTFQEIRLYNDQKRIDFISEVEVTYKESLVKVSFPFAVGADFVTTEVAYGTYKRPTRPKTDFEKARWEVWTQKYLDLSGAKGGVTLVNSAKYGFDVRGDRIRLTLVKGGIEPDPNTDVYTHRIDYALLSHHGSFQEAHAWRAGYAYNFPILGRLEEEHTGTLPPEKSFGSVYSENVCWEVLKPEEEGNGFIVRVYEVEGTDTDAVTLRLPCPVEKAEEIDFLELKEHKELHARDHEITFSLGHNEIKTIRFMVQGK